MLHDTKFIYGLNRKQTTRVNSLGTVENMGKTFLPLTYVQ